MSLDPAPPSIPAPKVRTFSRKGNTITLQLDVEKFDELLRALGTATSAAFKHGAPRNGRKIARLCDLINDGNPSYRPYNFQPEAQQEPQ